MYQPAATSATQQTSKTPKVINCIWAGGTETLPLEGINIISEWARNNTDFKIYLWVDEKTAGKTLEELKTTYRSDFQDKMVDVVLNEDEHRSHSQHAPVYLKDIHREGLRNELVAYEIELNTNYGSSSDLLRYEILKRGGAYFDCTDVQSNPVLPLRECDIFKQDTGHCIYVDHLSQNISPTHEQITGFNLQGIGNDTFLATPNNPLIERISSAAQQNYNLTNLGLIVFYGHASNHPKVATIPRTGPELVRTVVKDTDIEIAARETNVKSLRKRCGNEVVQICKVREEQGEFTKPATNTNLWIKKLNAPKALPLLKAVEIILKAIQFEASHFHYLRLDYHIQYLVRNCPPVTAEQALKVITSKLQSSTLQQVQYVPVTGQCPLVLGYCRSNSLLNPFSTSNLPIMNIALRIETNQQAIMGGLADLTNILRGSNPDEKLQQIPGHIKLDWGKKMEHGLRFIEFMLIQDNNLSTADKKELLKSTFEILTNYNQFNGLLLKCYPGEEIYRQNNEKIGTALRRVEELLAPAKGLSQFSIDTPK